MSSIKGRLPSKVRVWHSSAWSLCCAFHFCIFNAGTVPMLHILNVGTVPKLCILKEGTVPTFSPSELVHLNDLQGGPSPRRMSILSRDGHIPSMRRRQNLTNRRQEKMGYRMKEKKQKERMNFDLQVQGLLRNQWTKTLLIKPSLPNLTSLTK